MNHTTPCDICKSLIGITTIHPTIFCPVKASLWCTQCGCYGHTSSSCTVIKHVWRPTSLEDLIPDDVKERWNIDTQTSIVWTCPTKREITMEDCEQEIANSNSIIIRFRSGKPDNAIRTFLKTHKMTTAHKMDDNIVTLREWAIQNGKKIVLLQEQSK